MGNGEHKDGLQERGRKKKFVSEKGYQSITEVRSGLEDKNKGEVFTMTSLFLYRNKISTNKKPYRPFECSDITSRCPPPAKMGISMKHASSYESMDRTGVKGYDAYEGGMVKQKLIRPLVQAR